MDRTVLLMLVCGALCSALPIFDPAVALVNDTQNTVVVHYDTVGRPVVPEASIHETPEILLIFEKDTNGTEEFTIVDLTTEDNNTTKSREKRNVWDKLLSAGAAILGPMADGHLGNFLILIKKVFGPSTPKTHEAHGHDYNSAGADALTYDILRSMLALQQVQQGERQEVQIEDLKLQELKQEQLLEDLKEVESDESSNIKQSSTYELATVILLACLLGVFTLFCFLLMRKLCTVKQ